MVLAVAAALVACGSDKKEAKEEAPEQVECCQKAEEAVAEEDKTVQEVAEEAAEDVAKEAIGVAADKAKEALNK